MNRYTLTLMLPLVLVGCSFFQSINKEEVRDVAVEVAIEEITKLNEDGFDPLQLNESQRKLALLSCKIIGNTLATKEEDELAREELEALVDSVCIVLDKALAPGEQATDG